MDEIEKKTLNLAVFALNVAATKFNELGYDLKANIEAREDCKFTGKLIPIQIEDPVNNV